MSKIPCLDRIRILIWFGFGFRFACEKLIVYCDLNRFGVRLQILFLVRCYIIRFRILVLCLICFVPRMWFGNCDLEFGPGYIIIPRFGFGIGSEFGFWFKFIITKLQICLVYMHPIFDSGSIKKSGPDYQPDFTASGYNSKSKRLQFWIFKYRCGIGFTPEFILLPGSGSKYFLCLMTIFGF